MVISCVIMRLQLRKDFEEDKQRTVSSALAQAQRDADSARRQMEERCKEEFAEELKKVVQKHKTEISATKKKQWVGRLDGDGDDDDDDDIYFTCILFLFTYFN